MPYLFESAVAAQRVARAVSFLTRQPPGRRLLVIAPSALASRALLDRALAAGDGRFGFEHGTLHQLAARLSRGELAQGGRAPLSPLSHEALSTRALERLSASGGLGRLSRVYRRPGLPRALSRTVHELSLAALAPHQVAATAPELSRFYEVYRALLQEHALIDDGQLLSLAKSAVEDGRHPLVGLPVLLFDVPLLHRSEQRLAAALVARAPDALATVPAGDARTRRALEDVLTREPEGEADGPSLLDDALARLQSHLFERRAPRGSLGDEVVVMSAPGESRESVEVVRRLLWAAERGTPFDRMAVLLRSGRHYRSYLEEGFARAGVPAFFAAGSTRPDPSGRALLSLLACREEDLSARAFAEYLSLDVVPRLGDDGSPPAGAEDSERWVPSDAQAQEPTTIEPDDAPTAEATPRDDEAAPCGGLRAPRRWERLLVDAAVIGGLDRWRRRLSGLRASLELRRDRATGEDGDDADSLQRDLDDLAHLQAFALPLLQALSELPESAPWGRWLDALGELATRAIAKPARVLAVLAELRPLSQIGPVGLTEVRRVLTPRLGELSHRPEQGRGGKVFVADIEAARGLSFDLVCVMGLSEKIFPQPVAEDPILLDDDRAAIDEALMRSDQRIEAERLLLRIAVGAARRQVLLSYPRIDLERARPRVPSFYGLEVVRAAEGELPSYTKLMERADLVAPARVGWPAPPDANAAIDDAEHDLALLSQILTRDPGDTRGSARYLLQVNPHLSRALRARARRWSVRSFTRADGLVDPGEAARAALAALRLSQRPYAVTTLECYAQCPYRFALRGFFRLLPRKVPAAIEQLDPQERGALMHEIQFDTLWRLREADLLPLADERLARALALLEQSVHAVADAHRERLAPAIDRVFDDGVAAIHIDLKRWLSEFTKEGRFQPLFFELAFGSPRQERSDPQSQADPIRLADGRLLRGSIDLVEQRDGRLSATDHKSGKVRTRAELIVGGGAHLQPLLYAMALERLFPAREVVQGRLYYCTSEGGFESHEVPLLDETRARASEVLDAIDTAIGEGFLPAAPADQACARCDYRSVCGPYEEQRIRGKDPARLAPVKRLRRLP